LRKGTNMSNPIAKLAQKKVEEALKDLSMEDIALMAVDREQDLEDLKKFTKAQFKTCMKLMDDVTKYKQLAGEQQAYISELEDYIAAFEQPFSKKEQ